MDFIRDRLVWRLIRLPVFALLVITLASCAGSGGTSSGDTSLLQPPKNKTGAVKVALLLPLTGNPNAQGVAKAMKQAAELALFDFDKSKVQLSPKDTRGTPDGARAAAQDAVKEGAELIVGPLFAAEVSSVTPVAQAAKVPVLAFSSDRTVAGNGIYLLSFVAGAEVSRIVTYAVSKGKTKFAGFFPQNDYGRLLERAFAGAVQANRVQLVATKTFAPDPTSMIGAVKDFAPLVRKGAPNPADAIFIPAGADLMPSIAPLLATPEIDLQTVRLLGGTQWDYPDIARETALQGGWFAAPDPKGWQEFSRKYTETYGDAPPRLASLAYDAVSLAISLSNSTERFSQAQLTRATGFSGVDGLFRLHMDGTAERGFAIVEVGKSGNQVVDPAPASFGPAIAQY